MQNLLLEKDTTLSRYQELLKTERMEHSKSCSEYQSEVETCKVRNAELNEKIRELTAKIHDLEDAREATLPLATNRESDVEKGALEVDGENEMSFNLLDSNRFEEIYVTESREFELAEKQMEIQELQGKLKVAQDEVTRLQQQLMDVSRRETGWESALAEKDLEIESLIRKLKQMESEGVGSFGDRGIEELKDMLEEKDRHIQDLTRTLEHFHVSNSGFLIGYLIKYSKSPFRMITRAS